MSVSVLIVLPEHTSILHLVSISAEHLYSYLKMLGQRNSATTKIFDALRDLYSVFQISEKNNILSISLLENENQLKQKIS